MKKYLFVSEIKYSFLRQRHQIFADHLSNSCNVIFLERVTSHIPSDLMGRLFKSIIMYLSTSEDLKPNILNSKIKIRSALLLPEVYFIFKCYNYFRSYYLLQELEAGDILHCFVNSTMLVRLAKKKGVLIIFDIIHNWYDFQGQKDTHLINFKYMIENVDAIISDSCLMLDRVKKEIINKPLIKHIPPGVESSWFLPFKKKNVNGKINIAFFGNLRANSDIDIFMEFINQKIFNLELYGYIDDGLPNEVKKMLKLFYKGYYPVQTLIEKMKIQDAFILPYDKSAFSSTIFPAKYFELLATGRPIFSNSNLFHLPAWKDIIWTTDDLCKIGFDQLFNIHYHQRSSLQIGLASQNTWQSRLDDLEEVVNEFI